MKSILNANIRITEDADEIPLDINLKDENHFLKAEVDSSRGDIYLSFSSRVAMYDFARSLLHASVYGKNESIEFYPLISGHKRYIVNGVRLSENSSRIFVHCPVERK